MPTATGTSLARQLSDGSPDGTIFGQSTTDPISFYGATASAQQASTVDLITQLVTLGLIPSGTAISGTGTPVNVTASTLTVTAAAHAGRVVTLNRAAGVAVTLPAATGTGNKYTFQLGTTVTSNTTTITTGVTGTGCDSYEGNALLNDSATVTGYTTAAPGSTTGSDVITLNGSTTGGFIGDIVDLTDIGAGLWLCKLVAKATGTAATPFSHT
jgi:hypothetical protein